MTRHTGGRATKKRMEHRNKQMKWLLENFTEPCYMPECSNNMASLSDSFNIENENDLAGYDPCGITMTILNINMNRFRNKEDKVSYYGVARFMLNIQCYLPKSLRGFCDVERAWSPDMFSSFESPSNNNNLGKETEDLLDRIGELIIQMKVRIENDLACKYLLNGKIQHIEVLKRRFKNNWSDKPDQLTISNATGNDKVNLNISFSEITKEDESKS